MKLYLRSINIISYSEAITMNFSVPDITEAPAYQAADGTLFKTPEEAAAYSASEFAEQVAEQFVDSKEFAQGQSTRARNIVIEFVKWFAGKQFAGNES